MSTHPGCGVSFAGGQRFGQSLGAGNTGAAPPSRINPRRRWPCIRALWSVPAASVLGCGTCAEPSYQFTTTPAMDEYLYDPDRSRQVLQRQAGGLVAGWLPALHLSFRTSLWRGIPVMRHRDSRDGRETAPANHWQGCGQIGEPIQCMYR